MTMTSSGANDTPARMSFLTDAVRAEGLSMRALDAAGFATERASIPVLVAYIDRPNANDAERHKAADAIRALLGPTATASAPDGNDPAAWREWLARQAKP